MPGITGGAARGWPSWGGVARALSEGFNQQHLGQKPRKKMFACIIMYIGMILLYIYIYMHISLKIYLYIHAYLCDVFTQQSVYCIYIYHTHTTG